MFRKSYIFFEFSGPKNELETINTLVSKYQRSYEERDLENFKELAKECGIEQLQIDYFINESCQARLDDIDYFRDKLAVRFATNPHTSMLLRIMMSNIKGNCKCDWYEWGNYNYSATFFNEDIERWADNYTDEFTENVVIATAIKLRDVGVEEGEDMVLYNEHRGFLYELDVSEYAVEHWCDYHDFDREDRSDEEMLEFITNNSSDYYPVVFRFKKLHKQYWNYIPSILKVIISGDMDIINELTEAVNDTIRDHNGYYGALIERLNDDFDYEDDGDDTDEGIQDYQILEATNRENCSGETVLELTVLSYFISDDPLKDPLDKGVDWDFDNLQSVILEQYDKDISFNIWQVAYKTLASDCIINDKDNAPPVGYLSVNAQDEFGDDAKFLICDHLDDLINRWCELVSYDGERKEATEMLDIINNYSYQHHIDRQ